jgi:hypothetical protein
MNNYSYKYYYIFTTHYLVAVSNSGDCFYFFRAQQLLSSLAGD